MMFATDNYDEPRAWWRRRQVVAAVGVALVVLLMLFFVVQPWADDSSTPSPPEAQPTSATSSECGLPDGEQAVPDAGPSVDWRAVDQVAVPVSPTEFGPGRESDGIYLCFGRNPTGALLAAAMDVAQGGSATVDQVSYVRARFAREGGYEAALEAARNGAGESEPSIDGEIAGFRVLDYSSDRADVEIVARVLEGEFADRLLAVHYTLKWSDGDWRIVSPAGDEETVTAPSSLAGYVEWSPRTAGVDATPSAFSEQQADREGAVSRFEAPVGGVSPTSAAVMTTSTVSVRAADEDEAAADPCDKVMSLKCTASVVGGGLTTVSPGAGLALEGGKEGAKSAGSAVADSAFSVIAQDMVDAQEWALENLMTAWLKYPDPDLRSSSSTMVWLQDRLQLFVVFVTLGAVLLAAYRLATTGKFEHLGDMGMVFVRVILTGGLVGVVTTLGLEIGDLFSDWVLAQVEFDLTGLFVMGPQAPTWILLISGLIIVLVQFFQFLIMIFRYGCVIYLCGSLTLFAAASNTRVGKQGWEKSIAWLLAFVFYKPVAALIYAVAIKMTNPDRGVADIVAGIGMMVLAIFALPAMMRLIAPHTAALGGGNAGALAGATVGAAVATGAVVATAGGAAAAGGFAGAGGAGAAGGGFSGGGGAAASTVTAGNGGGGATSGGGPSGSTPPSGSGPAPESMGSVTGPSGAPGDSGDVGSPGLASSNDGADASGGSPSGAPQVGGGGGASGVDLMRGLDAGGSAGRGATGAAEGLTDDQEETT